jgi:hypothetical protein
VGNGEGLASSLFDCPASDPASGRQTLVSASGTREREGALLVRYHSK